MQLSPKVKRYVFTRRTDTWSYTSEAGEAVARERIDCVRAVSTPMTRLRDTVIYVNLTVAAAESSLADTAVAVHFIEARSAVETW